MRADTTRTIARSLFMSVVVAACSVVTVEPDSPSIGGNDLEFEEADTDKIGLPFEECEAGESKGVTRSDAEILIEDYLSTNRVGLARSSRVEETRQLIIELKDRLDELPDDSADSPALLWELANAYGTMALQMESVAESARNKGRLGDADTIAGKARQFFEFEIMSLVKIHNGFPDDPDFDRICFSIGFRIDQLSRRQESEKKRKAYLEKARPFYQTLIMEHPDSIYVPAGWFIMAENYFFDANDFDRALRGYEKVIEWGVDNNPFYPVARSRQAMCMLEQERPGIAVRLIVEALLAADELGAEDSVKKGICADARRTLGQIGRSRDSSP